MKLATFVGMAHKKQVGPRYELVVGDKVITAMKPETRWKVTNEAGDIAYHTSKPKIDSKRFTVEEVSVLALTLGDPKADTDEAGPTANLLVG